MMHRNSDEAGFGFGEEGEGLYPVSDEREFDDEEEENEEIEPDGDEDELVDSLRVNGFISDEGPEELPEAVLDEIEDALLDDELGDLYDDEPPGPVW